MKLNRKAIASFFTATALLLPFYPALAAQTIPKIQPLNKPFGGKITKIQACQSPAGLILHIGPPSGGQYFFDPAATKLHQYKTVMPGVWTLGLAQPVAKTCVGNPAGVGGFSAGGIAGTALSSLNVTPLLDDFGGEIGVTISSSFSNTVVEIGGEFGEALAEALVSGLGSIISVIQIAYAIYSLIQALKKPPTLGPAYPIIRMGTGPAPASNFSPPLLTPI